MKQRHRTILFFSFIALVHTQAFAQTEEPKREEIKPIASLELKPVKIEPIKIEAPKIDLTKIPKLKPIEIAPEKEVQTIVSDDELKELGIGYAFDGKSFVFTGNISKDCAEKLSSEVKKETAPALASDSALEKIDNLNEHTSKVGGRLTFHGNKQLPSLSACQKLDEEGEKIDLSKVSELKRVILADDEIAFAGSLDGSNKVVLPSEPSKSEQYKKLEAQIKIVDCSDCTNPKKNPNIMSKLAKFDVRIIAAMFPKVIEESLKQFNDQIEAAKSTSQLEKIRDQLVDLAKQAYAVKADADVKTKYLDQIAAQFEPLLARNEELAAELKEGSAGDAEATRAVDFKSKTYYVMADLPGMSEESKSKAEELGKSYAKGGDQRIEFLSLVRPAHKEVEQEVKKRTFKQNTLARTASIACASDSPMAPSPQCFAAMQKYNDFANKTKLLQGRIDSGKMAVNMNGSGSLPGYISWYNPSASGSKSSPANVNNLFTLNPQVFPNATEFNQNSGIYANSPSYAQYSPYGKQYDLVYNQAYNNPYMNRGRVSMTPNSLPVAIPINPGNDLPFPTNAGAKPSGFQPTFVVNDSLS